MGCLEVCRPARGTMNQLQSGAIPLLASPQGGVAARLKNIAKHPLARPGWFSFRFDRKKPPRPIDDNFIDCLPLLCYLCCSCNALFHEEFFRFSPSPHSSWF